MWPNYGTPKVALARGNGAHVWDLDGKEYLDFIAGIAVNILGHANPAIIDAVTKQMEHLVTLQTLLFTNQASSLRASWLTSLGETRKFSSATLVLK